MNTSAFITLGGLLAALALPTASIHAQALKLVGMPERIWQSPSPPVHPGENVALEMLLMPGTDMTTVRAHLVQIAGTIAAPLDIPVTVESSPHDERLALVRFTAPKVTRITELDLRLSDQTRWPIFIVPSLNKNEDQPDLVEALKTSRLQLILCGPSVELRDYLKSRSLPFEDLGSKAPRRLRDDEVLIGDVTPDDWTRLTAPDTTGRLIVTVGDPAILPGVHTTIRASGPVCKITLPFFLLLPDNPQAANTLDRLLHTALTPASN